MADVAAQLREILDGVAARIADPPDRRYVADGRPAFDCAQLTVHLADIASGTPDAQRPSHPTAPTSVTALVTRTWCVPTVDQSGRAPRTTALDASGSTVTGGAVDLYLACRAAAAAVSCRPTVDVATPIEPSGGYVGWQIPLRWTI